MNVKKLTSRFFFVLTVIALVLASISCSETETTDSTKFTIYYSGMTDIGPSMSGIVSSPTYKGSAPYDFAITQVTLKGEPFNGDSFTINPDNGSISINNTTNIAVGLYRISISCASKGSIYEFKDIIEVNMMNAVPEGISVEPNKLKVDYADITDETIEVELPTAQVKTDGDHVSIRKYEIAESATSKFFAISQTGEISIIKGSKEIVPGTYVLSLKLTTGASTEDEGLFENAVEINVTSKPLVLTYTPDTGKIEEETNGGTTYTTTAPALKGSPEGVSYTIKNITPATDKIEIDKATGVLSVAAGHGFTVGQKFAVDVNVVNEHAPEGVDFNERFTLEVVGFIEPIENFKYEDISKIQATAFELKYTAGFKGDEVSFELTELDAALQGQLSIDHEGTITAPKGNTIPLGTYTVKVKAFNTKGEATTTFTLTVRENEHFFTYIRYGNNLGLTPEENYANQFRVRSATELAALVITPKSDIREGSNVSWKIEGSPRHQIKGLTINGKTGEISFASNSLAAPQCGMLMVTATTGEGTDEGVSISVPVFFNFLAGVAVTSPTATSERVTIEYTPFVLQANPKKITRSAAPTITGVTDPSKFRLDYRRTFNYYNIKGSHKDGQPSIADSFLAGLWDNYYNGAGKYSSKDPLSFFSNKGDLSKALGYVDNAGDLSTQYSVVINPEKWIQNGEYANGAMVAEMTFVTNGDESTQLSNGNKVFPIFIWFDDKF